jgi:hypothetical protein
VEWAARRVVLPRFLEFYSTVNDFNDIGTMEERINEGLWDSSGHARPSKLKSY